MLTSPYIAGPILMATFAAAFIIVGYEDHARRYGWPVGAWLSGAAPPLKVVSLIVMVIVIWKTWWLWPWWAVPLVPIGGFFIALFASVTLRAYVQIPSVLVTIAGGLATLLIGADIGSAG